MWKETLEQCLHTAFDEAAQSAGTMGEKIEKLAAEAEENYARMQPLIDQMIETLFEELHAFQVPLTINSFFPSPNHRKIGNISSTPSSSEKRRLRTS